MPRLWLLALLPSLFLAARRRGSRPRDQQVVALAPSAPSAPDAELLEMAELGRSGTAAAASGGVHAAPHTWSDVELELQPPGWRGSARVPAEGRLHVGELERPGSMPRQVFIVLNATEHADFQQKVWQTFAGEAFFAFGDDVKASGLLLPSLGHLCAAKGETFHLTPELAATLLPPAWLPAGRDDAPPALGAGFCLGVPEPEPAISLRDEELAWTVTDLEKRFEDARVQQSALLTLQSWLFYLSRRSEADVGPVQDGTRFNTLRSMKDLASWTCAGANCAENYDMQKLNDSMDVDLARFHIFREMQQRLPFFVDEGAAKEMLREVISVRLRQNKTRCWKGDDGNEGKAAQHICAQESYAQAHIFIAGSLLAVVLEACTEQLDLGVEPSSDIAIDPVAVTLFLFSTFLDCEIGTFLIPSILSSRVALESRMVFGDYYGGSKTTSWFGRGAPSMQQNDDYLSKSHMDKMVMQFYLTLAFTASGKLDTLAASRVFWRYFFKVIGKRREGQATDGSVIFYRAALVTALSKPRVALRSNALLLTAGRFSEALNEWIQKRAEIPDDPEAPVAISTFGSGLREAMRAAKGLATRIFTKACSCARDGSAIHGLYQAFTGCSGSVSDQR